MPYEKKPAVGGYPETPGKGVMYWNEVADRKHEMSPDYSGYVLLEMDYTKYKSHTKWIFFSSSSSWYFMAVLSSRALKHREVSPKDLKRFPDGCMRTFAFLSSRAPNTFFLWFPSHNGRLSPKLQFSSTWRKSELLVSIEYIATAPNSCITSELCTFFSLREFPLFFPFYGLCVQPSPTGPFISAADPLHWKRGEEPIRVSVTAVVDVVTENRVTKPGSKKPWVCTSIRSILGIAE